MRRSPMLKAAPYAVTINMTARPQKITLAEMRSMGPSRLLIYCGNYKCSHSIVLDASLWSSHPRLSELEQRFVCTACGHRGADIRPLFEPAGMGTRLDFF